MTKQNIKLTIMFIFGLPALPIAGAGWLFDRYIMMPDSELKRYNLTPKDRMLGTKEHFIAYMCAWTMFFALIGGLFWLLSRCQ